MAEELVIELSGQEIKYNKILELLSDNYPVLITEEKLQIEFWSRKKEKYKTQNSKDRAESYIQFSLKEISELMKLIQFQERLKDEKIKN